jgi:hypothetical protein
MLHLELAQVVRGVDGIQKRRFTKCGHGDIPILQVGTGARREMGCASSAQRKNQTPTAT